ncbi:protein LONGIFOLIA 1 isoform X2 [Rhodamnia argentea]|uniref:Protein LONGIFOLIA 1 isoform X2 n=1 Tax=Rhodamnia argentea TaxID=178133 RepID=A0A8B8PER0_9MYRT|nr:protein LONGIFOLIA 1 isoform X2 [Rhodamnia argentea]
MAAKLLQTLADDNPDLQKQIGCMTGIFQIFDRPQMIASRRYSHKRLLPGNSQSNDLGIDRESANMYLRQAPDEVNFYKSVNEKQRFSTESSRASFSSTCSSSLSSLECSRTVQPGPSSFDQITFPEAPSRDATVSQSSPSPNLHRKSLDLRDVVKDSMYREARGLSVKTTAREEVTGRKERYRDSLKPLQPPKPTEGSSGDGFEVKRNVPADLNESLKVLTKLQEAPWYFNDVQELSRPMYEARDGAVHLISKVAPRFSYDGKELNCLSFESRETIKSTPKLKELPRLSLDSRESSILSSNSNSKTKLLRSVSKGSCNSNERAQDPAQSCESQKRPPSVVAKLMGLEALPDSASAPNALVGSVKSSSSEPGDSFSIPLTANGLGRPTRNFESLRNSSKEPESPRWRNHDAVMKPISRSPNEPAPWRQMDGNRRTQKLPVKPTEAPQKPIDPYPSVYGEIEKRLKDLEFKQSGKDLRALKQILEAIQAKGLLETRKEEQASHFGTQKDPVGRSRILHQNSRLQRQQNMQSNCGTAPNIGGSESSRSFESPIVIMKPAKLVEKHGFNASSMIPLDAVSNLHKIRSNADSRNYPTSSRPAKDPSPKIGRLESTSSFADKKASGRSTKSTQTSSRPQLVPKENPASSAKSSGSVSLRLQQKKLELERRSRPPTPPSGPNKPRKLYNRQSSESSSPGGRHRHRSSNLHSTDDQLSEISNDSRTPSCQGDDISVHSDSSIVFESQIDAEVISSELPTVGKSKQSPCMESSSYSGTGPKQKKSILMVDEDETLAELNTAATEYHSPVSVLDSSVHTEDAPTPTKQMVNSFRGNVAYESDYNHVQDQWNATESLQPSGFVTIPTSEVNRRKLQNIELLVQKLRGLNSSHDEERTDYIASLCENAKPDHRYVSEILLASGLLLRDFGSSVTAFQLHPSGHPINPKLFLVLEQTKSSAIIKEDPVCGKDATLKPNQEKIHRKLIFDAVNEILVGKLSFLGVSYDPWLKSEKLARKSFTAQKLLKELCMEIEQLDAKNPSYDFQEEDDGLKSILWEDVLHRSESWTEFNRETSGMVLDIERSIFKDLINEVMIGEMGGSRARPSRRLELFGC